VAKRKKQRRPREKTPTVNYTDPEADAETQRWVRQTIAEHLGRHIPELAG
jgi:predicted RNA-binding protein with PUA-like domain